jgi:DNA-binding NarL/FixJ family response regulator
VTEIALLLFVEYHNTFREAASVVMDQQEDLEVVSQASSVAEGRERMAQGGIDAAIVDIYPCPTRVQRIWSATCTRPTHLYRC